MQSMSLNEETNDLFNRGIINQKIFSLKIHNELRLSEIGEDL
jgi:hypothetical protein